MPCMCGDICCPSCGPAQGNWRCPICRVWASEACEHMNEEGDGLKAEFEAQAEAIAETERLADEAFAQQLKDEGEIE
jgi:hypothetical protein